MAFTNLPNIQPAGPGGRLFESFNAVNQAGLASRKQEIENQFKPITSLAEGASKLAYANLMGPQFIAKMLGNPDIVANSQQLQNPATTQTLYQEGMGQGTNNVLNQLAPYLPNQNPSLASTIVNGIKNVFGNNTPVAQSQNALKTPVQANTQTQVTQGSGADRGQSYDSQGRNVVGSDQDILNASGGNTSNQQNSTYAGNAADYRGRIEEGVQTGKNRANDIEQLNTDAYNFKTGLATLDDLNNMISSPIIREIRQTPLLGRHEIAWFAKEGTPAQQQLVGRLQSQMGNVIKDSSRDFAGQFRTGEQQLLQGMKPNDSDTVDVMIGKQESLTTMLKMLYERTKRTAKLMEDNHISKGKAMEMADKQINAAKIRENIHDQLNPMVTLRNPKTGQVITIPIQEAKKGGFNHG